MTLTPSAKYPSCDLRHDRIKTSVTTAAFIGRFHCSISDVKNFYFFSSSKNFFKPLSHPGTSRSCHRPRLPSIHGKIIQIDAFGCYYSAVTIVALYEDGTVKGKCEDRDIEDISDWKNVKKICCGGRAAVMGLTEEGKVLLSKSCKFKDRQDNEVVELDNIIDIAANFEHFIALSRIGEIIYLRAI